MMNNIAFWLTNLYVVPFWALMIFAPHWEWTRRICSSLLIFLPLAMIYVVLLIIVFSQMSGIMLDISTPEGLARMFSHSEAAVVGWIHYLVFDLFVGRWAYFDSRERRIIAWWVSPTLVFIYLAGPLGLLLYLGVRWLHNKQRLHTQQQAVS
jgi:hypothetical protein